MIIILTMAALALGVGLGLLIGRRTAVSATPPSADGEPHPMPAVTQTSARPPPESDPCQLASYALAAGQESRASFILEKHLQDRSTQTGASSWHLLLDIHHGCGNRIRFDELREQYRLHFAEDLPGFNEWKQHFSGRSSLQRNHPALLAELHKRTDKQEAEAFIHTLIQDSARPGRPSYNLLDAQELLRLRDELQEAARVARTQASRTAPSESPARRRAARSPSTAPPVAVADTADAQGRPQLAQITILPPPVSATSSRPRTQPPVAPDLCALEADYPRIIDKLQTLWPSEGCARYLDSLIIDDRGGRQGFSPAVMSEILFLKEIMQVYHPGKQDVWSHTT